MKKFKSKFGFELFIFLSFIFGSIIGFMFYQNEALQTILSVGGIFLLVYAQLLYLHFSTSYLISEDGTLHIRMGLFYKKTINIASIVSVSKTNSLLSAPAPSLDRIELIYGKNDSLVISPKEKVKFVHELQRINSEIKSSGLS
jgi:hypothetical protein